MISTQPSATHSCSSYLRLLQDRNVSEEVSIASEALLEELRIDGGAFHEKRSEKEAEAAPSKIRPTSEQKRATLRTEEVGKEWT